MIGENRLLNVISILGTALAICVIMVIIIPYVMNTASFKLEVNRDRTYYITTVMSNGRDDSRRISYSSLGLSLMKECCYPLKGAGIITTINVDHCRSLTASSMDEPKNQTSYIFYTDTIFWKISQFDFQQGGLFSPVVFTSGIRDTVISESMVLALFGTDQVVGREVKLDFIVYNIYGIARDIFRFTSKAWAKVWIPYTIRDNGGYQEDISGSYSCYVLLKPGATREELRIEIPREVEEFNAKTRDAKAGILHQPPIQIEEWVGGGSGFEMNLFYLCVRCGIILFILLLAPALNLSGITLSRVRRRMVKLGVRRAFGATQGTIFWQMLFENIVLTSLDGLLGLAMSCGATLLLRNWLLVTSLGKAGFSTGVSNGTVFIAAFLFCLALNLLSIDLPVWRMSGLNITDFVNGRRYV